jgi:hypothetical protein
MSGRQRLWLISVSDWRSSPLHVVEAAPDRLISQVASAMNVRRAQSDRHGLGRG